MVSRTRIRTRKHQSANDERLDRLVEGVRREEEDKWTKILDEKLEEQKNQLEGREQQLRRDLTKSANKAQKLEDQLRTANDLATDLRTALNHLRDLAGSAVTSTNGLQEAEGLLISPESVTDFLDGTVIREDPYMDSHQTFMDQHSARPLPSRSDGGSIAYQVSKYIELHIVKGAMSGSLGPLLAKGVMHLITAVLKHQKGTLVCDPITYRGNIGVFVRGGKAKDAAMVAANLRPG